MKVLCWNMGVAFGPYREPAAHDRAWHWVAAVDPDLALLQETNAPDWVRERWTVHDEPHEFWASAIVARRGLDLRPLTFDRASVLGRFGSYLATAELALEDGTNLLVASVHTRATVASDDDDPHGVNATGIGVRGEGSDPLVVANTISGGRQGGVVVDEAAAGRFDGNTVSGSTGAGVWVDDHGTAPRFTGNHVSTSGFVGILVTDGGGGEFDSNDLRGNAAGSWKLDAPGDLRRTGNLEDAGLPPEAARPDPPVPGARLVN